MDIYGWLAGLPTEQRDVVIKHDLLGLSFREIGEDLGISKTKAHTLYTRAKQNPPF